MGHFPFDVLGDQAPFQIHLEHESGKSRKLMLSWPLGTLGLSHGKFPTLI